MLSSKNIKSTIEVNNKYFLSTNNSRNKKTIKMSAHTSRDAFFKFAFI